MTSEPFFSPYTRNAFIPHQKIKAQGKHSKAEPKEHESEWLCFKGNQTDPKDSTKHQ